MYIYLKTSRYKQDNDLAAMLIRGEARLAVAPKTELEPVDNGL